MKNEIHILLVDDDRSDYVITRDLLDRCTSASLTLTWAPTCAEALERCAHSTFDIILLDYMLGDQTGLELLVELRAHGYRMPVIMLTAVEERAVDEEALRAGADEYLIKSELSAPLLERVIRYAVERHALRAQMEQSRDDMLSILDELRAGTAITDRDGHGLVFVSQTFAQLLGRARAALIGSDWRQAIPVGLRDQDRINELMARPVKDRSKLPLHWETPAGRHFWVELEIKDDPRDAGRKIFVLYDITQIHGLRALLDEKAQMHSIIGRSAAMQNVYRQIQELAKYDITVLIEGETGTGKELVARALHSAGERAEGPFIAVNCGGLTESLLASQLFGHRRGAFTGATSEHAGYFEAAQGGTLFLDEVGDIPFSVQTTLLRALQEREIVRVGDSRPLPVDVHIIAATNRDLGQAVEDGEVRQDFLYRIRVAQIQLPPLRDRKEDIPMLADGFLRQFQARCGKMVEGIAKDALALLLEHDWPGNVRELQNIVETAAIKCQGTELQPDDLPLGVLYPTRAAGKPDFKERERRRILDALDTVGGNRAKAARTLGISRTTLYRRMTELNVGE